MKSTSEVLLGTLQCQAMSTSRDLSSGPFAGSVTLMTFGSAGVRPLGGTERGA